MLSSIAGLLPSGVVLGLLLLLAAHALQRATANAKATKAVDVLGLSPPRPQSFALLALTICSSSVSAFQPQSAPHFVWLCTAFLMAPYVVH